MAKFQVISKQLNCKNYLHILLEINPLNAVNKSDWHVIKYVLNYLFIFMK